MRTLILSDIHGNFPALEAIFKQERNYDACLFLGDVVDYGPFPIECIQFLMENMDFGVIGNHDNAIVYNVDCGCRGDFKQFSEETRAWHKTLLQEKELSFLRYLNPLQNIEMAGKSILLAHASPKGDLFLYLNEGDFADELKNISVHFAFVGHTHIQFQKKIKNTLVVNPGSVGLARDAGGVACYVVFQKGEISLHRIPYHVEKTVQAIWKSPISIKSKEGLTALLKGNKV